MNCRKQLFFAARGTDFMPPTAPINVSMYLNNLHLRAYCRHLYGFLEPLKNSQNATIDSYNEFMAKIVKYLIPNAKEEVIRNNVAADSVLHYSTGMSFLAFSTALLKYIVLATNSMELQTMVDKCFDLLNFFNPVLPPNTNTSLKTPPFQLPLTKWEALLRATRETRPCFVIMGVNTQRTKLFEKVLASMTGSLLLDIPSLLEWPLHPAEVEAAKMKLIKGGKLTYEDSEKLILQCAKNPIANYRGWILPASFKKSNFDLSSLFSSHTEMTQRCFLVDLTATLEDLLTIASVRTFDPVDEKILTSLQQSSPLFIQRLKRREFVGREIDDEPEEEQEEDDEEEDKPSKYIPPSYETSEERGDEAEHPEEEDERSIRLPEESEDSIKARYAESVEERSKFSFSTPNKRILVDATQSLKEMAGIVCDASGLISAVIFPTPPAESEDEQEEEKLSQIGEYCPVTLVNDKELLKCDEKFTLQFYEYTFRFASREKMEEFAGNPSAFLPEIPHSYHRKIIITGSKFSGKRTVSKRLAEFFDSEITELDTVLEAIRDRQKEIEKEESNAEAETQEAETQEAEMEPAKSGEEEDTEGEKDETKTEEPETVQSEQANTNEEQPPQKEIPTFPRGYIIVRETISADDLALLQSSETLTPDAVLELNMKKDRELLRKRLLTAAKEEGLSEENAEALLETLLEDIPEPDPEAEHPDSIIQVDAFLDKDEVFWTCVFSACSLMEKPQEGSEDVPKGAFGVYCPVTLKDKGILVGGTDYSLVYQGALYSFADSEAQERFRHAPLAFIERKKVPPPRIVIFGSKGTGKTTIATELARVHNVPLYSIPSLPPVNEENEEEEEVDLLEVETELIKKWLETLPDPSVGYVIEGAATPNTGQILSENGFKPEIVILLTHNDTWSLLRTGEELDETSASSARDAATLLAETTVKQEPFVVDTSQRLTSTLARLEHLYDRQSLFYNPQPTEDFVFQSHFGRYCPVCGVLTGGTIKTSLLWQSYSFCRESHLKKFNQNPLKYAQKRPPPRFPPVPRVSVIGSDAVAERLAKSLDCIFITPRLIVTKAAKHETCLGARVRTVLSRGQSVDSKLFVSAMLAVLSRHDCKTRGYVLSGLPVSTKDLLRMKDVDIHPQDIISIKDNELTKYCDEKLHCVCRVQGNDWKCELDALTYVQQRLSERRDALIAIDEGRPYVIEGDIETFPHFCPVRRLADGITVYSNPNDWRRVVAYNGKIYHLSDEEALHAFLISPIPFSSQWSKVLPVPGVGDSESTLTFSDIHQSNPDRFTLQLDGYDVVRLAAGEFIKGHDKIVAAVGEKLFRFESEATRSEFCRNSLKYLTVVLPERRPVQQPQGQIQLGMLPSVAFLEQSVGNVVSDCFAEIATRRPKIPGKGIEESLNIYAAKYIKAHTKDVGPLLHKKFQDELDHINDIISLASNLKASLDTPAEMRDDKEHERLCALWEELRK